MTVTYSTQLATVKHGVFLRLIFRWKGSAYQLIWIEALAFSMIYITISLIYRYTMNETSRDSFEKFCQYCEVIQKMPLDFILGFFIATVIARWWETFKAIPFLNEAAFLTQSLVCQGNKAERNRIRRNLMRQLNVAFILKVRQLSMGVWNRFARRHGQKYKNRCLLKTLRNINRDSTIQHIGKKVFPRMIKEKEKELFARFAFDKARHVIDLSRKEKGVDLQTPYTEEEEYRMLELTRGYEPEFWLPLVWAANLIERAYEKKYIKDIYGKMKLLEVVNDVRNKLDTLSDYDEYNLPLVYVQVVIIGVYSYFLGQMFATQCLDPKKGYEGHTFDVYVPFLTILQFIFYVGWLKVGEALLNPYGEDPEDFSFYNIINANVECTYDMACSESGAYDLYPSKEPEVFSSDYIVIEDGPTDSDAEKVEENDNVEKNAEEHYKKKYLAPDFRGSAIKRKIQKDMTITERLRQKLPMYEAKLSSPTNPEAMNRSRTGELKQLCTVKEEQKETEKIYKDLLKTIKEDVTDSVSPISPTYSAPINGTPSVRIADINNEFCYMTDPDESPMM